MEVGGAYVRIRPFVSDEDARALAALHRLCTDIGAAFDRFYERLADDPSASTLEEGARQ